MRTPIILIQDFSESPPLTTSYMHGDNEIDFGTVYKHIRTLHTHKGHGKLVYAVVTLDERGPVIERILQPCTAEFLEAFWQACAWLLDYFADFEVHDTAYMTKIWFALVDTLNEVAKGLPHQFYNRGVPSCAHSDAWAENYHSTLKLLNRIIQARPATVAEDVVHGSDGLLERKAFEVGDFKAGLKPWAQFLAKGSPGFALGLKERKYERHDEERMKDIEESGEGVRVRHVPMGALALVMKRTERARELAQKEAETTGSWEVLNAFDREALNLSRTQTYTSLAGRPITTYPFTASELSRKAPRRFNDLLDRSLLMADPKQWMLHEAVGNYLGMGPVEFPDGEGGFRMVTVVEDVGKDVQGEGDMEVDGVEGIEGLGKEVLADMFDDWKMPEERN